MILSKYVYYILHKALKLSKMDLKYHYPLYSKISLLTLLLLNYKITLSSYLYALI